MNHNQEHIALGSRPYRYTPAFKTAVITPETPFQEEGIYLAARNSREILVYTLNVQLPRRVGMGLGLELIELVGGREDGLGITVVPVWYRTPHAHQVLRNNRLGSCRLWHERRRADRTTQPETVDITAVSSRRRNCYVYLQTISVQSGRSRVSTLLCLKGKTKW
jgi:hypothetical protein